MHYDVPLQACAPSYQRRTASTLRISLRPLVWRTAEASLQTVLVATGAQPVPPPIPLPMETEEPEEALLQTRARTSLKETNGTAWLLTSVMTLKLSDAVWTRREWRRDMASKGSLQNGSTDPQVNWRHELNGSDEGGPEHWPNILLIIFSSNCQEDVSESLHSWKTSTCYHKNMKSRNALMQTL